jgi:hypothetical protein
MKEIQKLLLENNELQGGVNALKRENLDIMEKMT